MKVGADDGQAMQRNGKREEQTMIKAVVILLCVVIVMLIFLGSMIKLLLEEVAQIHGALIARGYLKGADDEL